jgi:hypothetical protein
MSDSEKWVVLASERIDGVTTTQIVSVEYASEAEANDFAADVQYHNPSFYVDVCTLDLALDVVTD